MIHHVFGLLGMLVAVPVFAVIQVIIKEIIEVTSDETIKNLGRVALEWAEKDLKPRKSPFSSP